MNAPALGTPMSTRPLPRRPRGRVGAARGDPHRSREALGARARATRICWRCRSSIAARSPRLSVARETSLDLELITYLEGLCARAYFFVYGVRTSAGEPASAPSSRAIGRGRSQACGARHWSRSRSPSIGALAGYLLVAQRSRAGTTASSRRASPTAAIFSASAEFLRSTLYDTPGADGLSCLRDLPVHPQQPGRDHALRLGLRLRRADRDAADPQRRDARRDPRALRLARARPRRWAAG